MWQHFIGVFAGYNYRLFTSFDSADGPIRQALGMAWAAIAN